MLHFYDYYIDRIVCIHLLNYVLFVENIDIFNAIKSHWFKSKYQSMNGDEFHYWYK